GARRPKTCMLCRRASPAGGPEFPGWRNIGHAVCRSPAALTSLLLASLLSAAPVAAPAAAPVTPPLEAPAPEGASAPEVGVPFGCGLVFPVSQGHDIGSHLQYDTYAWDFRMPEGTPVVAAEDGVVRMARGDSTVGGCDMQYAADANYVVVRHPNGMETQYL